MLTIPLFFAILTTLLKTNYIKTQTHTRACAHARRRLLISAQFTWLNHTKMGGGGCMTRGWAGCSIMDEHSHLNTSYQYAWATIHYQHFVRETLAFMSYPKYKRSENELCGDERWAKWSGRPAPGTHCVTPCESIRPGTTADCCILL